LKGLIGDTGHAHGEMTLFCNSFSVICLTQDYVQHGRTKISMLDISLFVLRRGLK